MTLYHDPHGSVLTGIGVYDELAEVGEPVPQYPLLALLIRYSRCHGVSREDSF